MTVIAVMWHCIHMMKASKTVRMVCGNDWVEFRSVAGRGVVMTNSLGPAHSLDMTTEQRDYRISLLRPIGWVDG